MQVETTVTFTMTNTFITKNTNFTYVELMKCKTDDQQNIINIDNPKLSIYNQSLRIMLDCIQSNLAFIFFSSVSTSCALCATL